MTNDVRVADWAISLIRTWVPIAVGSLLAWLATSIDVALSPDATAAAGVAAAAICSAGYYALARGLEQLSGAGTAARVGRHIGHYMLGGVFTQPAYGQPMPQQLPTDGDDAPAT